MEDHAQQPSTRQRRHPGAEGEIGAAGSSGDMAGEVSSAQESSDWCLTSKTFAVAQ